MVRNCDNLSVGVIMERKDSVALLRRAKFPIAVAPPAGHVDEHGSLEMAAIAEVREELGLTISLRGLIRTPIVQRTVSNRCRRPGGDHHDWTVFRAAEFSGSLRPSVTETKGAGWYDKDQLQWLADRTKAFEQGAVTAEQWQREPGLEGVWADFMTELGYLEA